MSRDLSGNYTLPGAVNPVVAGTVITDTWGNTTMNDVATALTDSLSRSGKGGMTAPLTFSDGTVSAPSFAFATETTTGIYRIGVGSFGITVLGVNKVTFTTAAATFSTPVYGTAPTLGDNDGKFTTAAYLQTNYAPLISPSLQGVPLAPTAAAGTANTQISTTDFVATAINAAAASIAGGTISYPAAAYYAAATFGGF